MFRVFVQMLGLLTDASSCPCCVYPFLLGSRDRQVASRGYQRVAMSSPLGSTHLRSTWLTGLNLVDVVDGSVSANVSLRLADGRIAEIIEGAPPSTRGQDEVIAASGKFVVPGYCDMHSHVLELDDPEDALSLMLADGVTGFRQMSGNAARLDARRNGRLTLGNAAPELLEMPGAVLIPLNADTPEKATAEVASQVQLGADFIKIGFVSPAVLLACLEAGRVHGIPVLGHLQEGVHAGDAAKLGFRSVEHLGPGIAIWAACSREEAALNKGMSPVRIKAPPEWLPFLRRLIERRLQLMLINPAAFTKPAYTARLQQAIETFDEPKLDGLCDVFVSCHTWQVPTLVRLRTQFHAATGEYDDHPFLRYMPASSIGRWRRVSKRFKGLPDGMRRTYESAYPAALRLAKGLADRGVQMMVGTDGGWMSSPGLGIHDEFVELERAGFSPLAILQMATLRPAEYLGREDRMGVVAAGRNADLVLLNADPTETVKNLGDIHAVIRAGRVWGRAELDAARARVAGRTSPAH